MGSDLVNAPQKTPTTLNSFTNAKFTANLGIDPEANPITNSLPFLPIDLASVSKISPPTGSNITSMPFPPEISFNFNRVKDSIKNSMKKQKNDIKNLFNKEKNSSKELDKTPDYNNIIEWEEDDNLL